VAKDGVKMMLVLKIGANMQSGKRWGKNDVSAPNRGKYAIIHIYIYVPYIPAFLGPNYVELRSRDLG
jgi:hypothetical protein